MKDFKNLKELLEKETYPHVHFFKFIGKNSSEFEKGIRDFLTLFPALVKQSERLSQNGKHISHTYSIHASSAEAILDVYKSLTKLPDLLMVF